MGNCCVTYRRIILPSFVKVDATHKLGEALEIVKSDGKVLEFSSPILPVPSPQSTSLPPPDSFTEDSEKTSSTRRVRIVLTKKELQQLLAKQVSMEELLLQQLEKTTTLCSNLEPSSTWKPALAAIPEGVE